VRVEFGKHRADQPIATNRSNRGTP
jgi:hypothetical protein